MSCWQVSKYRPSRSRTSSVSRVSERVVNPTRSANRTETSRRSITEPGWGVGSEPDPGVGKGRPGVEVPDAALRSAPHTPQNLSPGSLAPPQAGQAMARVAPHSEQNRLSGRFSVPQFGHVTLLTPPGPSNWRHGSRSAGERVAEGGPNGQGTHRHDLEWGALNSGIGCGAGPFYLLGVSTKRSFERA